MLNKVISTSVIVGLIVVAVIFWMDAPGGPSRELDGLVKGTAVAPVDTGPSAQVATVALSSGLEVQAVNRGALVHSGQAVRVREHRGIISGRATYEISGQGQAK